MNPSFFLAPHSLVSMFKPFSLSLLHCSLVLLLLYFIVPCFIGSLLLLCPCFDVPSCHFKCLSSLPPYLTTPLFHYSKLGCFLCPDWYSPFWVNALSSVSILVEITFHVSQCKFF